MSDDIQKNEDIKGGQIAQTVQGNQIQINNTYLSVPSKSLKDYDKEIFVQSGILAKQTKKALAIFVFTFYLILVTSLFSTFKTEIGEIELKYFIFYVYLFIMISLIFFSIIYLFVYYKNRAILKIENDKLTLSLEWKKELILIEYKDIRGYLIEKNFLDLGANFFIYKINELNPSMTFQVVSVHQIIAIEELLKNKLIEK
ncbi:MAG: hypothetical protein PHT94_04730 [Candidatus Nanoarchaeia archaeon]|uniref:hypothetical protein n=1 Tax=Aliarcobacter cryaerophilus TaxID=28198 RepID=UPI00164C294F|nr:hypothetical protein [Aliarcobacter cryaerophilus]MDD3264169.1 hypothetical protein [Candidatus Nanoarchaeia archaeon]QNK85407.1 hypothetical protein HOO31_01975 [Aliarcobacter cryaerophilus]